jgi:hypothetical protein
MLEVRNFVILKSKRTEEKRLQIGSKQNMDTGERRNNNQKRRCQLLLYNSPDKSKSAQ